MKTFTKERVLYEKNYPNNTDHKIEDNITMQLKSGKEMFHKSILQKE